MKPEPRQEAGEENQPQAILQEGRDYYVERGYWVFTADFLRRRGWCCGSGCRHCPYGEEKKGEENEKSS